MKSSKKILKNVTVILLTLIIGFALMPANADAASKKPAKVSGVKITKVTKSTVILSWKKASRAKGYAVYKKATGAKKWSKAVTTKNRKATVKKLKSGKKYSFKVRAYAKKKGKKVWGKYSAVKTVKTKTKAKADESIYKSWTQFTEDGSSIEWKIDHDNTLHIRPISGNVGIINNEDIGIGGGSSGSPHCALNYDWYDWCKCSGIKRIIVDKGTIRLVGDARGLFKGFKDVISIDANKFDTSNVTKMGGMFMYCKNLLNLDLSNFDTSRVRDMEWMFMYCSSLTNLDLSNFDTSNVVDMNGMFYHCSGLTSLDLSNFDTSNVYCMGFEEEEPGYFFKMGMFEGCSNLTSLDLSNFNTSNVRNMHRMFDGCSSLKSLDVSNFDTSNVVDMNGMFYHCSGLTSLDLSNFDTRKAYDMSWMFKGCSNLKSLDLSNFYTINVERSKGMFEGCAELNNIIIDDVSDVLIQDVIGYDKNETENLLTDWYQGAVWDYENDKLLYRTIILEGEVKNLPSKLKIDFGVPGVTYNITESDKEGYAKKLTVRYKGETEVWYVKYETSYFDRIFGIDGIIGYDKDETENLLTDWYEDDWDYRNGKTLYRTIILKGEGNNFPPKLKIKFVVPGITYTITESDKEGYAKKLTASYEGETRVWYVKYRSLEFLEEGFKIGDIIGYDKDETENLLTDWYEDKVWDDENDKLLYRTIILEGEGDNFPPKLKIKFVVPGITYTITESDKEGYAKKLTASYEGETCVWYVKYGSQKFLEEGFEIDDIIGYDKDETKNLLTDWNQDDVWDDKGEEVLYRTIILKGEGNNFPPKLKISFAVPGITYAITDSDKEDYTKKLTASYEGETCIWYVKYEIDLDRIFVLDDITGYDEDETENLLTNWYENEVWDDENDKLLYRTIILEGEGQSLPSKLKIDFAVPSVTYTITDSEKEGYAKKLTASYAGETRVWYVKYESYND